ncbi:MAG TPA: hypothetical protein VFW94_23965 [Candidatus Acidoferrales bacterium]|nr:hypothetical protein [Candidatus Acidoferrales bacterium]
MSKLATRKSRAVFETDNSIWERRRNRAIIIELKPDFMVFRIKGTRREYPLSYTGALNKAIANEALRRRLEKAKKKGLPKR